MSASIAGGSRAEADHLTQEYSGLPGSSKRAHFFKSTAQFAYPRSLYPGSPIVRPSHTCSCVSDINVQHLSVSSLTTFLLPLYPRSSTSGTYLPDRTFLGGPNSIRGWKAGGLGLRDGPDSLGGDLSWAMGLSIFAPVYRLAHLPLRLHSFVNVGKVVGYDSGERISPCLEVVLTPRRTDRSFRDNLVKMCRNPNVSVGIGLRYRCVTCLVPLGESSIADFASGSSQSSLS
jgi:outer membrane protein insertion porin family